MFKYDDPLKKFLLKILKSIPLFSSLSLKKLLVVAYSLKPIFLQKDEVIIKEEDPTNYMYIIQKGWLEVYSKLDGNEFVYEMLTTASVLNPRLVVVEELSYICVRCATHTQAFVLSIDNLNKLKEDDEKFASIVDRY